MTAPTHGSPAHGLPGNLTEKLGPLPVYAWAGILGAGAVGYLYWKRSHDKIAGATDATVAASTTGDATGYPILGPGQVSVAPAANTDTGGSSDQTTTTNNDWRAKAFKYLVAGGADPIKVTQALSDYLTASSITYDESLLISQVTGLFGEPPEGTIYTPNVTPPALAVTDPTPVPVVSATATPTPPAPSAPAAPVPAAAPATRTYTIVKGDTLSGIAKRYYGSGTAAYYNKIYNANRNVLTQGVSLIHPGQVIVIPY